MKHTKSPKQKEMTIDQQRIHKLVNLIWRTRWASGGLDYQHMVFIAGEIRSGSYKTLDALPMKDGSEPTLHPFLLETWPKGAWAKDDGETVWVFCEIESDGLRHIPGGGKLFWHEIKFYSTDHGKTWLPAGVEGKE